MQRWEYRVVALRDGHYTSTLNEYGQEGWELVSVVPNEPNVAISDQEQRHLPMPRALGRLEDAAAKLNKLGAGDSTAQSNAPSDLLWVLRRPLSDD